jgi:hypothetical protein
MARLKANLVFFLLVALYVFCSSWVDIIHTCLRLFVICLKYLGIRIYVVVLHIVELNLTMAVRGLIPSYQRAQMNHTPICNFQMKSIHSLPNPIHSPLTTNQIFWVLRYCGGNKHQRNMHQTNLTKKINDAYLLSYDNSSPNQAATTSQISIGVKP